MRFITDLFHVNRRRFCIWIVGKRWSSGRESLIVTTSNAGFASAAIGFCGAGGSGMLHAVPAVARTSVSETVCNPVHVPASEFPSPLNFPLYVTPFAGKEILTLASCGVNVALGVAADP